MDIYLDIDGVLLANEKNKALYADEFIEYVVSKHSTYWLTTHCRQGENYAVQLLSRFFSAKTMKYIKQIKTTDWKVNKTEAINFSCPFLWFDDDLYEEERKTLISHGVLDNWIEVNLTKHNDALGRLLASFPIPVELVS